MLISRIIMIVMAIFFLVGAVDRCVGHRIFVGKEFERGFALMGPIALTVLGLMCIAPVVARLIRPVIVPLYALVGADGAMFSGTFLAPDSGGYFIAEELAADPRLALFGGIIVASVIGGVISFTIPMAYGLIEKEDTGYFAVGVLSGFIFDPPACFIGGLAMGLPARTVLTNLIPVTLCALLIILGLYFIPHAMIRAFRVFARVLIGVITIGLAGAAFEQMTGFVLIPGMNPIQNGFSTIGVMTLVLAGALTLLYTLRVVLRRPLAWLGTRLGVNDVTMVALVISMTSITPAYAMFRDMNVRGKVVMAAFSASMANMFGAHLGFASVTDPSIIGPMFLSKVVAGVFAIPTALFFCRRLFAEEEDAERSAATPR